MMIKKLRSERKHTPKPQTKGLYPRAMQQALIKLDPRIAVKNPVMFIVWIGTIITAITTLNPYIFGDVPGENPRLFNGMITVILFLTLLFANFAEAIAEGR